MYNQTLHDKTGSFIASTFASITELSDGAISDIQSLFESYNDLLNYIMAFIDVTLNEALGLCEVIFPHEAEDHWESLRWQ